MKIRDLSIVLLCFIAYTAQGQIESSATVRLTDGSIYKGEIVEKTAEYIKLMIATGDTVTISSEVIGAGQLPAEHKITRQPRKGILYRDLTNQNDSTYSYREYRSSSRNNRKKTVINLNRPFYVEGLLGYSPAYRSSLEVQAGVGLRVKDPWWFGLEYAAENYWTGFDEASYSSLSLHVRRYFTEPDAALKLHAGFSAGIGFPTNEFLRQEFSFFSRELSHALLVRPSVGATFHIGAGLWLTSALSLKYLYQSGRIEQTDNNSTFNIVTEYTMHHILPVGSIGVRF